jgi:hypothetical protein
MKKIALVLALLAVAGFVFADTVVTPVVTGDATLTFGVDLDNAGSVTTGFKNEANAKVVVTLVDKVNKASEAADMPYATITVKDIKVDGTATYATGTGTAGTVSVGAPSVEASVMLSETISASIFSAPSVGGDNAKNFKDVTDNAADANDVAVGLVLDTAAQGTKITVKADTLTINVTAVSDGTYTTNTDNDYAVGVDVALAGDMALKLGAYYGSFNAATDNLDVTVGATLKVAEGITVDVGADMNVLGGFDFDAKLKTAIALDAMGLDLYVYYGNALDVQVIAAIKAVENLTFTVTGELFDVLSAFDFGVKVALAYAMDGGLKPFANFTYTRADVMKLDAGVELSKIINKGVVTLKYETADLANDAGLITAALKVSL